MNNIEALKAIQRNDLLDQSTIKRLAAEGYVTVRDVTTHDTPLGQRELLVTFITEKGRQLLES